MIILLFFTVFVYSCSDPCTKCSKAEEAWLLNDCDDTICLDNQLSCNNSCDSCYSTSSPVLCSEIEYPSKSCSYYNSKCGINLFKSNSGTITLNIIPQATLCNWVLDMRSNLVNSIGKSFYLKINTFSNNTNFLKVLTYKLSLAVYDYSIYKPNTPKKNWNSGVWLSENIASIFFSTDTDSKYHSIEISWKCEQQKTDLSLESIIAIITVSVVLFLCCSCCAFCCFKFSKAWRLRSFQRSQRSRIYQVLPDNSMIHISDDTINEVLPVVKYRKELQEVGEPTCPICFEEFANDVDVRKTVCKHIFHCSCIENWIRNNPGAPFCPVCKQVLFPSRVEASRVESPALK